MDKDKLIEELEKRVQYLEKKLYAFIDFQNNLNNEMIPEIQGMYLTDKYKRKPVIFK